MFSVPSKPRQSLWEFSSRWMCLGFLLICSRILPNVRLGFHQAMKARRTCFISFIKLLFSVLTKRKTMYEALMILKFLSWNSKFFQQHCSRHFHACFIVLWKHTCRPIKMHTQSKLFYKSTYYFITNKSSCFLFIIVVEKLVWSEVVFLVLPVFVVKFLLLNQLFFVKLIFWRKFKHHTNRTIIVINKIYKYKRRQRTQKKFELQMGIEAMTFRTLVQRSTTEPRELIWRARSQYWVIIHGLYHTITEWH